MLLSVKLPLASVVAVRVPGGPWKLVMTRLTVTPASPGSTGVLPLGSFCWIPSLLRSWKTTPDRLAVVDPVAVVVLVDVAVVVPVVVGVLVLVVVPVVVGVLVVVPVRVVVTVV